MLDAGSLNPGAEVVAQLILIEAVEFAAQK
jgi:hypothetical protein